MPDRRRQSPESPTPVGEAPSAGPGPKTLMAVAQVSGGVAHDVGNALTAIVSRAALIAARTDDPEIADHAAAILRAARTGARVIGRVRRALQPLNTAGFVRVSVGDLMTEAVEMAAVRAQRTGVEVSLSPGDFDVVGDPDELVQVVVNLLHNGIDAAGAGGRVQISTRLADEGAGIEIVVADNGPGIPPDIAGRLFEPFITTKGDEGTGLGLALGRRVAESHGGSLHLAPAPGGGTEAVLALALAPADAPTPRRATSLELAVSRVAGDVLVVDDDEDAREGLAALLEAAGLNPRTASTVDEAHEEISRKPPTVLVTDLQIGAQSGWTLLATIRARHAGLPVVILSGDAQHVSRASARGADAGFTKPVNPGTLVTRVLELARSRAAWLATREKGPASS